MRFDPERRLRPGPGARRRVRRSTPLADPRGEYTDAEHAAATRVRAAYVDEMSRARGVLGGMPYAPHPRWDGCVERLGPEGDPPRPAEWLKVARVALGLGVDPVAYVRAQFQMFRASGPPRPNQLVSQRTQSLIAAEVGHVSEQIRLALTTQVSLLRTLLVVALAQAGGRPKELVWAEVLLTPDSRLTPLFRYCIAASESLADVSSHYREAALAEYRRWPALYDLHWARCLPPGFGADGGGADG